jgi:predicted DNA-binding transcriptional regulator AlpA
VVVVRDELLTVAQASDELKVSRATFYRWRALGTGPRCVKLPNGTIRIRRSELERFIASCEEPETGARLEMERRRRRRGR